MCYGGPIWLASWASEACSNWAQLRARLPQEALAALALAVAGSEGTSNFLSATPFLSRELGWAWSRHHDCVPLRFYLCAALSLIIALSFQGVVCREPGIQSICDHKPNFSHRSPFLSEPGPPSFLLRSVNHYNQVVCSFTLYSYKSMSSCILTTN